MIGIKKAAEHGKKTSIFIQRVSLYDVEAAAQREAAATQFRKYI